MKPDWEEAVEGCLGYLATEKSHAVNSQIINRIALENFASWMDQHHTALEPGHLNLGCHAKRRVFKSNFQIVPDIVSTDDAVAAPLAEDVSESELA